MTSRQLEDFSESVRVDPTLGKAYVNIGVWYAERGDLQEALRFFEQAAALGEPNGAHFAALVQAELGAGSAQSPRSFALTQEIVATFASADSRTDMERAVRIFPVLLTDVALDTLEQLITDEVPQQYQGAVRERLAWLREIAAEQDD